MALSARDKRIISAMERGIEDHDPRWARRFARRHRRFARRERRGRHPGARLVACAALCVVWFVLLCVAFAHRGPWIWIAIAVTGSVLLAAAARLAIRARRYGADFALRRHGCDG